MSVLALNAGSSSIKFTLYIGHSGVHGMQLTELACADAALLDELRRRPRYDPEHLPDVVATGN